MIIDFCKSILIRFAYHLRKARGHLCLIRFAFCFAAALIYQNSICQGIIVLDKQTNEHIKSCDFYCGEKFIGSSNNVTIRQLEPYNLFEIRALGYMTRIEVEPSDTFFLSKLHQDLAPVEITASSRAKSSMVGFFKTNRLKLKTHSMPNNKRIAVHIENDLHCESLIEMIHLDFINDEIWAYEVSLISVGTDGIPNRVVFTEYIHPNSLKKSGKIDISDYSILFPTEGIFVSTVEVTPNRNPIDGVASRSQSLRELKQNHLLIKCASKIDTAPTYFMGDPGWIQLQSLYQNKGDVPTPRFGLTVSECN